MEHLTRNTNNDRIVHTIKSIGDKNIDNIDREIRELINNTTTILSGVLSSIVSGIVTAFLELNSKICVIMLFLLVFLLAWLFLIRFAIPCLSKSLFKEKINLKDKDENESLNIFNYDIMQKVSEINEIVDVIRNTKIRECKMLNFVIALLKLQEAVDFLHGLSLQENIKIRKSKEDDSADMMRFSFNNYTIAAVVHTLLHIQSVIQKVLVTDYVIKSLNGYDLLVKDFDNISKKIDKLKQYIKE